MITLIWAQAKNGVIGAEGKLPWHLPAEMAFFKQITLNKTVLMGRKTWDSLTIKPLPQRENVVLTSRPASNFPPSVQVVQDLNSWLAQFENSSAELIVIGGEEIFHQAIKKAYKLIVSIINQDYVGDRYAPAIDEKIWKVVGVEEHSEFKVYTFLNTTQREIGS